MSRLHIPGFEFQEQVGKGGMAVVWKARQLSLERTVAIKVLSSHLSTDADDIERFKTEAQAEAMLKHPGIVQVYDANVESGLCYIVQEFVDGYSVGDWVRRKGCLSEEDALLVAGYIADALAYAWQTAGVIHCDIKPDNILIDADGSPKVTDLGLARTISAMTDDGISNEVMGTPAYMSPEQIQGLPDLDCRTDIYSLGAMLYQCVTGKLLFQGEAAEAMMEKHLYDYVPAVGDENSALSPAICGLIEKMLAKDRANRYADWEEVRADIVRAKRGVPPSKPLQKAGLSTVKHTPMPLVVHSPTGSLSTRPSPPRHLKFLPALAALMAIIVGVMAAVWGYGKLKQRVAPAPAESLDHAASAPSAASGRRRPQRLLAMAHQWRVDHPEDFQGAENRYRRVMMLGAGTEVAQQAADGLHAIQAEREMKVQQLLEQLNRRADLLVQKNDLLAAAAVYVDYDGALALETAEARARRAAELRMQHETLERRQRIAVVEQRQWMKRVLDDVAASVLADGLAEGQRLLRVAAAETPDADQASSLAALEAVLEDAADPDSEIVDSFVAQVGDVVDVALKAGTRKIKVMGAVDGVVQARLVTSVDGVSVELQIRPTDLTIRERLVRMGSDDEPDVALAKGLMAWRAGAMEYAGRFFGKTDPMIADRLVAAVNARAATDSEKEAETALVRLLRSIGLPFEASYSADVAMIQLRSLSPGHLDPDRIDMAVARYRQQHGQTAFARANEGVLQAVLDAVRAAVLRQNRFNTGIGATESLTVDTLCDALLAANPGLARHEIVVKPLDGNHITSIQITSDSVRDLAPLGACRDLKTLTLSCAGLRDLSGLAGVPLEALYILTSAVQDLSPLRRMPLTELQIESSPVRDLMPLRGKLLTAVSVAHTRVGSLRGIMGMPLESLDLSETFVKRLDFLKGMPLETLSLAGLKISDLSVVSALPVHRLDASETLIKDLSFVSGSKIEYLNVSRTSIASLSGLRGSAVLGLNASGTRLRSLDGLGDVSLEELDISDTAVSDLEPLRGLPLRSLSIDGTAVTRLDVLRSLPLVHLSCRNLKTDDYSALAGLRIESISIADLAAVEDILKTMPNLTVVNGFARKGGAAGQEAPGMLRPAPGVWRRKM